MNPSCAARHLLAPARNSQGGDPDMSQPVTEIVVNNIKMPFGSMVVFMVKLAIATIPAMILLSAAGALTFALINFFLGGTTHFRMYRF